ncbi:MAG TPA: RNA polymerase sigma factor [Solirubrobacteraceae bacterium]|jgi:RNA polymerase sigma factor (sigma-70 family)|nr:RNA polymerase sigma factor [Solirubrobacteraceae bacterium]
MEVSALKPAALPAPRGPSPLLRLQSDERLIAMVRRGQHAAFETLFSRYHARLLAFCRHMLGSKEDAEDVLQEVFTAAFNAILADERELNVRPWLYRIARNRSLNHLRKASAIGVDSMDIHFAEGGISTGEKVMRRESFRQLIEDVQQLPESQRTALLLREIDALSYDQIAEAMETTIPSVKSLLVRARISLAEAAEARQLSCEEVRKQLGHAAEGLLKISAPARRHVRSCERCRGFRRQLKSNNATLAAVMPVGAALMIRKLIASKIGAGASHVAGGAGAGAGAGAAAGGTSAAGGLASAGVGAIATKAVAGLAAAALVTAGAVAAGHGGARHRHHGAASVAAAPIVTSPESGLAPVVVKALAQPTSTIHAGAAHSAATGGLGKGPHHKSKAITTSTTASATETSTSSSSSTEAAVAAPSESSAPTNEVVTETVQLPGGTQTSSTTSTTSTTSSVTSSSSTTSTPGVGTSSPVVTPAQTGGTSAAGSSEEASAGEGSGG